MDQAQQERLLSQLIIKHSNAKISADSLYTEQRELWQSLGFNKAQVELWLAALPPKNLQQEPAAAYQVTPDLSDHILSLLQHAGGRMPLTQVLKKLPAGITTSEQQIRKLAQQHAQLDIKGPWLVLVN